MGGMAGGLELVGKRFDSIEKESEGEREGRGSRERACWIKFGRRTGREPLEGSADAAAVSHPRGPTPTNLAIGITIEGVPGCLYNSGSCSNGQIIMATRALS